MVTIGYMEKCKDIVIGTYLRQTDEWSGNAAGLIAVVYQVGTSWTGEWYCQLRYLDRPVGIRTKAASQCSVSLREEDLANFEVIGPWIPADVLQTPRQPSGAQKNKRRSFAWRRRTHLHQLRLFDDL